jgi:hypothetical protein
MFFPYTRHTHVVSAYPITLLSNAPGVKQHKTRHKKHISRISLNPEGGSCPLPFSVDSDQMESDKSKQGWLRVIWQIHMLHLVNTSSLAHVTIQ